MGFMGGVARAVGGTPTVNVVSKVKNPAIQTQTDQYLQQLGQLRQQGQAGLQSFRSQFEAGTPQARTQTGQEVGAISNIYSGQTAADLAGLRTQQAAATNAAADLAIKTAQRQQNQSRLGEQGGGSSYDQRMAMAAAAPIRVQAALENARQARGDYGYVTGQKLALTGQRTALQNALAGRALTPYQTGIGVQNAGLGTLRDITNIDQANKFYGLQQDPNVAADILDSMDAGILNAAAIYGSVGGKGMGGARRGGLVSPHGMIRGTATVDGKTSPLMSYATGGMVSHGDYVMPAHALRLPGVLHMLEHIRQRGTELHHGHPPRPAGMGHPAMGPVPIVRRYASGGKVCPEGCQPINAATEIAEAAPGEITSEGAGLERRGGMLRGPGTPTSDSIPIHASTGEFIMPAAAVRLPGALPVLEAMRRRGLAVQAARQRSRGRFQEGGEVGGGFGEGWGNSDIGSGIPYDPGSYGTSTDIDPASFDKPRRSPGGGGGGGGGGLAGSAQQLNARAMADLQPSWQPATQVAAPSEGGGYGGLESSPHFAEGFRRGYGSPGGWRTQAPPTPASGFEAPENWLSLSPDQRSEYTNMYNRYAPGSPYYVQPGTYE
jgi:hypothetical protein